MVNLVGVGVGGPTTPPPLQQPTIIESGDNNISNSNSNNNNNNSNNTRKYLDTSKVYDQYNRYSCNSDDATLLDCGKLRPLSDYLFGTPLSPKAIAASEQFRLQQLQKLENTPPHDHAQDVVAAPTTLTTSNNNKNKKNKMTARATLQCRPNSHPFHVSTF